jgi:alpha-L-fucosidase
MSPLTRRQVFQIGATAAVGLPLTGLPIVLSATGAQAYTVPAKMEWWYAARFGMFIHFGSYSYHAAGEWAFSNENWAKADYQTQVSAHFNPTSFNAATIVSLARNAGMKYLVITAKHHEGFTMWDAKVPSFTDTTGTKIYSLTSYTAYTSDLLAALKSECDRQGLKFGLYYSILDWNHPSQTINRSASYSTMVSTTARADYITDMKSHLRDLITRYDPAVMWFDGDWCADHDSPTLNDWWVKTDGQSLYDYLIGLKSTLIVNERVKRDLGLGDFTCPEQTVPAAPLSRPWETNTTMNGAWGYNSGLDNAASYKSAATLIQEMVKVVSRDGNYLLNIGPKGDGTVPSLAVNILNAFGTWTAVHGDSIYGTTPSPFSSEPGWGYYTKKSGRLYAHVIAWPSDGQLQLGGLTNAISRIYLLNDTGTSLPYSVSGAAINVSVPTSAPDPNVSVVAVEVQGVPTASTTGTTGIVSGGIYKLVNRRSGKALDNGNVTADGSAVIQWTDNGGSPQQWRITSVTGGYKLVCARSGKALDDGNSTATNASMIQWTDSGAVQQQWTITSVGSGYYKLLNRHSGKALDNGNTTSQGATVIQWDDNGGSPQQWQLVRVG